MYVIAINGGVVFFPENEDEITRIKMDYEAVPVLDGQGWIPDILSPYYSGYEVGASVELDSYNYYFNNLGSKGLGYDLENNLIVPSFLALEDGYYVLETTSEGRKKGLVEIINFLAIYGKNIPQHPNIVNICDWLIKDYEQIIKNQEKQIAYLDKLVTTDLANLVADLAVIKIALATSCVNGIALNPTFVPAFTNSSQTDYNTYKTEINKYKSNILDKSKNFFDKLIKKIRNE